MSGPRSWTVTHYVTGLATNVVIDPIRNGTLRLSGHSPVVAGVAVFVGIVYAALLAAIAAARPLRAASDFVADTSRGGVSVIPSFLVPMLLFLLGLSFALVLAGSQRSHPILRGTMLVAVMAIVGSIVMVVPSRETAGTIWWLSVSCLAAAALYCVVMWWGRTPASLDFLLLFVLLEATIAAAYRSTVVGQASSDLRFDIVTTALLLTYLTLLASPLAFSGGLSAVGVGVATLAWSGDFLRRRGGVAAVTVLAAVIAVWQAWLTWGNARQGLSAEPDAWLRGMAGALLVASVGWAAWMWCAGRRRVETDGDREDDAVDIVGEAGRFGLPIGYGLQSAVLVSAILGMVSVGLAVLAPDVSTEAIGSVIEALSTMTAATAVRCAVVAGLLAAAVVLARRQRWTLAAVAAVDAVVIGSLVLMSGDGWLSSWAWTPEQFGDLGVVLAGLLAMRAIARRTWNRDVAGLVLVVLLMSALMRQAAILEVPIGLLLSASATALLIFGLAWGFVTGGSSVHEDSAHAHRDRRLLLFLGQSLYGIALVAWAVIGKEVDALATLSEVTALALLTVGTSLILVTVYQQLSPGVGGASGRMPSTTIDERSPELH